MILNILGIAGCTSLIFFSFSIKYSLDGISDIQFNKIHKYDAEVNLKPYFENEKLINNLKENNEIYPLMKIVSKIDVLNKKENNVFIYVVDDLTNLYNFVNLYNKNDKIKINDETAIISKRTLEILNKKIGDIITFEDIHSNKITLKIGGVFKNYFSNYVYISKGYYNKLKIGDYKTNTVLLKKYDKKYENLLKENKIQSINLSENYIKVFEKISLSLNFIVLFIVFLSAILSIVVTYSLLEINVNERKKNLQQ